ncbi:hypothetical protein K9U40_09260 [Xanthobacter autotrophicus]|uniref:hypothetical protein n=1 Tax=Xanthobacter TaxID=279 RepID=UPI0024AA3009|nr:hypothetical protein [Xanthobacter autotrophicus]MDI4664511.1 hypothetical protein [Xanthobacter autotrophicus]
MADTLPLISDGEEFTLLASDDQSHFVLRFKPDGLTADLSGEDAERFRGDYETVKSQFPDWSSDQVLAQLWDQGGYSWLAAQDG